MDKNTLQKIDMLVAKYISLGIRLEKLYRQKESAHSVEIDSIIAQRTGIQIMIGRVVLEAHSAI